MSGQELCGWLLDVYPNPHHGHLTLWLLGDDGERHCLQHAFPVVFYAGGPSYRLRDLGVFLKKRFSNRVKLARVQRRVLLEPDPLTVMEIRVEQAALFPRLFSMIERPFVDLDFYDNDIRLHTRYAARYDVFPMTLCRVIADCGDRREGVGGLGGKGGSETRPHDGDGAGGSQTGRYRWVREIMPLASRWEADPQVPPLRVLTLAPNSDPFHAHPKNLHIVYGTGGSGGTGGSQTRPYRKGGSNGTGPYGHPTGRWQVPLRLETLLLEILGDVLGDYDPDIIVTTHGDAWLIPYLEHLARRRRVPLPLSRNPEMGVTRRGGGVHHTYGQVVRRGPQSLLHGRLHIDLRNTLSIGEMTLEGILETARVGGLPVQTAARTSPGATLTSMKMITYLRRGIMIPNFKQQTEDEKDILGLVQADKGGLIFAPVIGLYPDVVEVDFTSMFPWIAHLYDISPETLDQPHLAGRDPRRGTPGAPQKPGMLGETLAPLLEKRQHYKEAVARMDPADPRYTQYKARLGAHKSIGVVAYGRTKFRKETDGKVEVHESITDFARKSLVLAKMAAESLGFRFLHGYVDALYLQKPGGASDEEIQALLDEITRRTGLPIVLEGQYRWMAFVPSKRKPRVPAANRFFGVDVHGELKVRGLASRRGDMPRLVAQTESEILALLAGAPTVQALPECVPEIVDLLRERIMDLRAGKVRLADLVVTQKLTKAPDDYRVQTATVRAAKQLHAAGKPARIADYVRYLYVRGEGRVRAWDLLEPPDPKTLDLPRYEALLLRAAHMILQMLDVTEGMLRDWVLGAEDMPVQLQLLVLESANVR
ncbi:MAG TPA: DNA polymerase domain-containing protein [Anaerolineales bacterium]